MSGTKNWEANSGKKTRKPCGALLDDSWVAYADKEITARTFHTPIPDRDEWEARNESVQSSSPATNGWPGHWHHSTTLCSPMRGFALNQFICLKPRSSLHYTPCTGYCRLGQGDPSLGDLDMGELTFDAMEHQNIFGVWLVWKIL